MAHDAHLQNSFPDVHPTSRWLLTTLMARHGTASRSTVVDVGMEQTVAGLGTKTISAGAVPKRMGELASSSQVRKMGEKHGERKKK